MRDYFKYYTLLHQIKHRNIEDFGFVYPNKATYLERYNLKNPKYN